MKLGYLVWKQEGNLSNLHIILISRFVWASVFRPRNHHHTAQQHPPNLQGPAIQATVCSRSRGPSLLAEERPGHWKCRHRRPTSWVEPATAQLEIQSIKIGTTTSRNKNKLKNMHFVSFCIGGPLQHHLCGRSDMAFLASTAVWCSLCSWAQLPQTQQQTV